MQRVRLENGAQFLLTSAIDYCRHVRYRNVIFTSAPLGVVLGCMKRHQMAQHYLKIKAIFGLIYRYYIFIPYVKSADETSRLLVPYRCVTGGDFRFTLRPCVRPSNCPSVCSSVRKIWILR